jgi:hypothetical protein
MAGSGARLSLNGSCHCGNLNYRFACADAITKLPARVCGCTFCTRHGARWTSDPEGALNLTAQNADAVSKYRFGHGTADFIICRTCGWVAGCSFGG